MCRAIQLGWTISARLRGDRYIHFRGLTASQALAAYRRLKGGASVPSPLLDDLATVSALLPVLDQADVQEVTIQGPEGEELLKLPSLAPVQHLG